MGRIGFSPWRENRLSPSPIGTALFLLLHRYTKTDSRRISEAIASGCSTDAPGGLVAWFSEKSQIHAMEMPGNAITSEI